MSNTNPAWTKIDRRLAAPPIRRGGRTIEAVAQMSGWQWSGVDEGSNLAGALVRIRPLEVRVREGEETQVIPLVDPVQPALKGMVGAAMVVSLFCWLTMWVAHWLTQRR